VYHLESGHDSNLGGVNIWFVFETTFDLEKTRYLIYGHQNETSYCVQKIKSYSNSSFHLPQRKMLLESVLVGVEQLQDQSLKVVVRGAA